MVKHRHVFRVCSVTNTAKELRCDECGHSKTIPMTASERRRWKAHRRTMDVRSNQLHRLEWAYRKELYDGDTDQFKTSGITAMDAMERFADKHPAVLMCGCDDRMSMSSRIALIPHRTETEYWGTTVVVLPQCGEPVEFFLYPESLSRLLEALEILDIETKLKQALPKPVPYFPKP